MKTKLLSILFLAAALTSCKDQVIEVQPITDHYTGSTWSCCKIPTVNGKEAYKVLKFTKPDLVSIAYRTDKIYMYHNVGEFTYLTQGAKIWVKNPDNTIAPGEIIDGLFLFGGETFTREKQ